MVLEELHGLVYGHVQYVGNTLATEAHLQCLAVVALATALLARHHHVGQEVHLYALVSVARTGLAPSALHVEGEASRLVTPYLCLGEVHEEVAYVVEHVGVRGRVAPRGSSQGSLVNVHHLVHVLQSLHRVVWQGVGKRAVEVLREDGMQGIVDERALSRTAHTCDADEFAQGEGGGNVLQVVATSPVYGDALSVALAAHGRNLYAESAGEVAAGQGVCLEHIGISALVHHMSAGTSGTRTYVHYPVGILHHLLVVLHHDDRVADVAQGLQRGNQAAVVLLMKAYGGFVQNV